MTEAVRAAEALQTEMLAMAVTLARQDARAAPADRFAEALKDVIAVHERRLAAFESFVPETVLQLLGLAALGGALLAGYGCGIHGQRNRLATSVHTVLVCLVILVIVDLDRPQYGMIRVSNRSLERLQAQLATTARSAPPPAARLAEIHPVRYRCEDGRDVVATFVRGDPPTVRLERGGVRWVLPLQRSGSGARYSDGAVTFWDHHGEARLEREGRAVTCRSGGSS
jgi:membrane-bound inhibitor of C-type lysozyme